jgi:hypothetical protein
VETSVIKHYLFKMSSIATHGVHVQELGHLMTESSVSLSNLLFCSVCVCVCVCGIRDIILYVCNP